MTCIDNLENGDNSSGTTVTYTKGVIPPGKNLAINDFRVGFEPPALAARDQGIRTCLEYAERVCVWHSPCF